MAIPCVARDILALACLKASSTVDTLLKSVAELKRSIRCWRFHNDVVAAVLLSSDGKNALDW